MVDLGVRVKYAEKGRVDPDKTVLYFDDGTWAELTSGQIQAIKLASLLSMGEEGD